MAALRVGIFVLVLTALILSVVAEEKQRLHARDASGQQQSCTNDPETFPNLPLCPQGISAHGEGDEHEAGMNTPSSSADRNRWCRLANGTYLPLGFSFLNAPCSICQCTRSRSIRCPPLQCMPTYCVDNKMPTRRTGQCCTQCSYEGEPKTCSYNNVTYPHGVIVKVVEDKMQCWCQLGNVECRNYMGTLLDGLMTGSAVYIIVIVLAVILVFGLMLCCGCTLGFYYYYQKNQQVLQATYEQYTNSAGWQPMEGGEEEVVDPAEAKRLEAEKSNFDSRIVDVIPPPYAVYNESYVPEAEQK